MESKEKLLDLAQRLEYLRYQLDGEASVSTQQAAYIVASIGQDLMELAGESQDELYKKFEEFVKAAPEDMQVYCGACPICGNEGPILNVVKEHFAVCHTHKVYWFVGSNLFSSWKDQSEATWRENSDLLQTYREVTPMYLTEPKRS